MRALFVSVAVLLAGCGGLDNSPLRLGVVRGVVLNPTVESLVIVEQLPELNAKPAADGRFEIAGVPQGDVALLVLASGTNAERLTVKVQGGAVSELGTVTPKVGARLTVHVHVPSNQSRANAVVTVAGVVIQKKLDREGEVDVALPSGCYPIKVAIRGLGAVEKQVCVEAPKYREVDFELLEPDGSAGREGCSVSGCETGYVCRSNGSCE
ncbi:MAG: hypothetical protein GQE15_24260 [Archangiaceae bacterium]|nr:hypothetical protein [Archangiaceae bacterium]